MPRGQHDLPSQGLEVWLCRRESCPGETRRAASYHLLLPYPGLNPPQHHSLFSKGEGTHG